jgi:PIN domain nuclease of toxin-antitoxin system
MTTSCGPRISSPHLARRQARGAGSLSLGDGLCIAVAERLGLPVTGGHQHGEALDLAVEFVPFR